MHWRRRILPRAWGALRGRAGRREVFLGPATLLEGCKRTVALSCVALPLDLFVSSFPPLPVPLSSGCPLCHLLPPPPLSLSSPAADRAARGSLTCPGKRGQGRGCLCSHPAPSLHRSLRGGRQRPAALPTGSIFIFSLFPLLSDPSGPAPTGESCGWFGWEEERQDSGAGLSSLGWRGIVEGHREGEATLQTPRFVDGAGFGGRVRPPRRDEGWGLLWRAVPSGHSSWVSCPHIKPAGTVLFKQRLQGWPPSLDFSRPSLAGDEPPLPIAVLPAWQRGDVLCPFGAQKAPAHAPIQHPKPCCRTSEAQREGRTVK